MRCLERDSNPQATRATDSQPVLYAKFQHLDKRPLRDFSHLQCSSLSSRKGVTDEMPESAARLGDSTSPLPKGGADDHCWS